MSFYSILPYITLSFIYYEKCWSVSVNGYCIIIISVPATQL